MKKCGPTKVVSPQTKFKHLLRIDCVLIDGTLRRYDFSKDTAIKMSFGTHERFQVECFKYLYTQIPKYLLAFTHLQSFVTLPTGETKIFLKFLPTRLNSLSPSSC